MTSRPSSLVRVRQRLAGSTQTLPDLRSAFGSGPWLVVAPHDDDAVIGMGLTIHAARQLGIEVHIAVATDGALGYVQLSEREGLVETRKRELAASCEVVGVPDERVHSLGFPDGSLAAHQGCRGPQEPPTFAQRLVSLLREQRPSSVFVCTPGDVHPDHTIAATQTDIACVWASGRIWLERGEPLPLPRRFHYACYAPFEGEPELEVQGTDAALTAKVEAMRCFHSQGVIEPFIEQLRQEGPYEYFKRARVLGYSPSAYRSLFV